MKQQKKLYGLLVNRPGGEISGVGPQAPLLLESSPTFIQGFEQAPSALSSQGTLLSLTSEVIYSAQLSKLHSQMWLERSNHISPAQVTLAALILQIKVRKVSSHERMRTS